MIFFSESPEKGGIALGEWLEDYYQLNIKPAFRNAVVHFRANSAVFAVVFLLELLLCTLGIAMRTNDAVYDAAVRQEYNYHILFTGLNEGAKNRLSSTARLYSNYCVGEYRVVDTVASDESGVTTYDVYIRLIPDTKEHKDDLVIVYYQFLQNYMPRLLASSPGSAVEISPLFYADAEYRFGTFFYFISSRLSRFLSLIRRTAKTGVVQDIFGEDVAELPNSYFLNPLTESTNRGDRIYSLLIVIAAAIGLWLLWRLFTARTNEHKHTYGIYVTFGADRRKLTALSAWEMGSIGILTLVPAFLAAWITAAVLYLPGGTTPSVSLRIPLTVGFWTAVMIFFTVRAVLRLAARRTPSDLLAAADNSDTAISPRHSTPLGQRFSWRYSALHLWRFRKYYFRLAASAALLGCLAVGVLYLYAQYNAETSRSQPEFTLTLNEGVDSELYVESVLPAITAAEGVTRVEAEMSLSAAQLSSHVLIDADAALSRSFFTDAGDGNAASLAFRYAVLDESTRAQLAGFPCAGTLTGDGAVLAVPDRLADAIAVAPGDTVRIARLTGNTARAGSSEAGLRLLRQLLAANTYEYVPYTVSAVVTTDAAKDEFTLYIPEKDYLSMLGTADASMNGSHILISSVLCSKLLTEYGVVNDNALPMIAAQTALPYAMEHIDYSEGAEDPLKQAMEGKAESEPLYVTNAVTYVRADADVRAALAAENPSRYLTCLDEGQILVSCSGPDGPYLLCKSGDPLCIGVSVGVTDDTDLSYISGEIARGGYAYTSFTIGAVFQSGREGIYIYLPEDVYYSLFSEDPFYKEISVYTDESLTERQLQAIKNRLRAIVTALGGGGVQAHRASFLRTMDEANLYGTLAPLIAAMLLAVGAPCLFYSLRAFRSKRESEMLIFSVFGAQGRDVRRMSVRDGLLLAGTAFLFYCAGCTLTVYVVYRILLAATGVPLLLSFPWIPFGIMGIVTAAAVFAASLASHRRPRAPRRAACASSSGKGETSDEPT